MNEQQAGSVSGTLNALQQVADAAGAALVSTMFPALATDTGDTDAAPLSLTVIAVRLALAAAITPLLPRHAAADAHWQPRTRACHSSGQARAVQKDAAAVPVPARPAGRPRPADSNTSAAPPPVYET